jgi:hypothetical protein
MVAPLIMVCGSRSLPAAALPLVGLVVADLLAAGSRLAVGCAAGADAATLAAALAAGAAPRVSVFAVGGADGSGFAGSLSALVGVRAALVAGASVRWWTGGAVSVPLRQRLAARSLACVRAAAGGGAGSGLVAFVGARPPRAFGAGPWPSCGSGSWGSVAAASRLRLPVFLVPVGGLVGVRSYALPVLPGPGAWSPVSSGVLSGGFRWVPVW